MVCALNNYLEGSEELFALLPLPNTNDRSHFSFNTLDVIFNFGNDSFPAMTLISFPDIILSSVAWCLIGRSFLLDYHLFRLGKNGDTQPFSAGFPYFPRFNLHMVVGVCTLDNPFHFPSIPIALAIFCLRQSFARRRRACNLQINCFVIAERKHLRVTWIVIDAYDRNSGLYISPTYQSLTVNCS